MQWPVGARRELLTAGAAFVATWSLGGFFQAFGPSVVAERLRSASPLLAAIAFSSVMVLNPLGGPFAGRLPPATAVRTGMMMFIVAVSSIVASLWFGSILPFIGASLIVGLAQGVASTGAMRALLSSSTADQRAGVLSTIYLIAYGGTAIPGIIAGRFARSTELFWIATAYAVLGVVAATVAAGAARRGPAVSPA